MGLKATISFAQQDRNATKNHELPYLHDGNGQIRLVVTIEIRYNDRLRKCRH